MPERLSNTDSFLALFDSAFPIICPIRVPSSSNFLDGSYTFLATYSTAHHDRVKLRTQ